MKREYLNPQPTIENPVVVDDYPWGFRRTKVRYWVESRKGKGDRFCKQTLNPKTNKWCNPKKCTYSDLILVWRTENGHIKHSVMLSIWHTDTLDENIKTLRATNVTLSPLQELMIKELKAIKETRKHISYEMKTKKFRHKKTGEIVTSIPVFELEDYEEVKDETERSQKDIKQDIGKLHQYNRMKEGIL